MILNVGAIITCRIVGSGQGEHDRRVQVSSGGPPDRPATVWARTTDDGPARWVIVSKDPHPAPGKPLLGNHWIGTYYGN